MKANPGQKGYVYIIRNTNNGKWYVGSTVNKKGHRWPEHRRDLRKNKHCNEHLQRSFNKHGEKAFTVEVHKEFDTEAESRTYEDMIIKENLGKPDFYNAHDNASQSYVGSKGRVYSEETKKKIGDAHRGKTISEEQKQKLRDSLKAYYSDPKNREAVRQRSIKQHRDNPEHLRKAREKALETWMNKPRKPKKPKLSKEELSKINSAAAKKGWAKRTDDEKKAWNKKMQEARKKKKANPNIDPLAEFFDWS